jgi:hypothetical protein
MNALPITIFCLTFTAEFALREQLASSYFTLIPDALSGIALLVAAGRYLATRTLYLDARHLALLGALLLCMSVALVWQAPESGAIVSGLRHYFKFVPLFLLAAVYEFSARQIKIQLVVLATLLAIQPPLAVYQRFVQFAGDMHSGDLIMGSVSSSGSLSLVLICAIGFIMCAYLRGHIGFVRMIAATVFLSIPTMINETKIAIVLIPLAVATPFLCLPNGSQAWKKLAPLALAGTITVVSFVVVFNFLAQYNRYATPMADFLTERSLTSYLYTGRSSTIEEGYIGRADSLILAVERLSRDPMALTFGLGIGNVSSSPLKGFSGEYARYETLFGASMTQVSQLLWEVGLAGTLIYLLLFWVFLRDALWLSKQEGLLALFGHSWVTTMVLLIPGLFYVSWFSLDEISAPMWFFSGVVAAERVRQRTKRIAAQRPTLQQPVKVSLPGVI